MNSITAMSTRIIEILCRSKAFIKRYISLYYKIISTPDDYLILNNINSRIRKWGPFPRIYDEI